MAVVRGRRRLLLLALGLASLALVGALLWHHSQRLPVAEARRFFHAPIQVGEAPPAPGRPAPPAAEMQRRYGEAQAVFRKAHYPQAAAAFAAVVAADPSGPLAGPAQWNLTRARLRSGDGNGALDALDALLRHYTGWLEQQSPALGEGIRKMADGKLAEAQAAFERMIDEQPDSELVPLAWALVARIHWNHGEPMQAIGAFASLFASVKDEVPAYRELGGLLHRYAEGDATVAEDFAARARGAAPGFEDIYQYLAARSLLEQNRFDETHKALEALRKAHPEGDFTHIVDLENAWNLFRNGQPGRALPIFQRLEKEQSPERARAFDQFFDIGAELPMGIARCQLALGNYAEAVAAFERALVEHPRSIYVLENQLGLALAYEKLGQLDRAESTLKRAVAEHAEEPRIWAVKQQLARVQQAARNTP